MRMPSNGAYTCRCATPADNPRIDLFDTAPPGATADASFETAENTQVVVIAKCDDEERTYTIEPFPDIGATPTDQQDGILSVRCGA